MNNKLTPSRIAKATEHLNDELRWAEACMQFSSEAGQKAASEAKEVYETCLAALEFVREAEPCRLRQDHFDERMQDEDFRKVYEALEGWKGSAK